MVSTIRRYELTAMEWETIKAYIPEEQFDEESLKDTLSNIFLPDVHLTYTLHHLENKDWNEAWEQNGFDPILE